jgi:Fuc2NAc and GlcNAc transferase
MNVLLIGASLLACGWLSWFGTKKYLLIALEHNLVDVPNHRSSHSIPTPRGGGIVFATVFLGGVASLAALHLLQPLEIVSLFAGALVAVVGFWDDCAGLPIIGRLAAQILVSMIAIFCVLRTWWPQVWNHHFLPLILIGAVFGFVWLINLTNFMDGIDGIATTEIVCVSSICCLMVLARHNLDTVALSFALLAVSTSGFLFWNWPPASVFMGDAGSCFLGYMLGALILTAVVRGDLSLATPLILLGVFIIDASLTLGKRMIRGERWYLPHCTHAFQHAAKRYGHLRTTSAVAAINIIWLGPLAVLAESHSSKGWLLLAVAWLPLVVMAQLLGAGAVSKQADSDLLPGKSFLLKASGQQRRRFGFFDSVRAAAIVESSAFMNAVKILLLAGLSCFALYLALLSQFTQAVANVTMFSPMTLVWAVTQSMILVLFRVYRTQWRLMSMEEIPTIAGMSLVAALIGAVVGFALFPGSFVIAPQRFVLFECFFLIFLTVGMQIATPLALNALRTRNNVRTRRRIAIFGADQAGADILASLRRLCAEYEPLGFIDSRQELQGAYLCGLPVLGTATAVLTTVETYGIHELLLPSNYVSSKAALALIQLCKLSGIDYTIVHSIEQDIRLPAQTSPRRSAVVRAVNFPVASQVPESAAALTSWSVND